MTRCRWGVLVVALASLAGGACAGGPVAPVIEGYLAQRSGQTDEALSAFRRALAADPDSVAIRAEIVRLLGRRKMYDDALEVCDQGLERRPEDPDLLFMKAKLLQVQGRRDEAANYALRAAAAGGTDRAHDLAVRLLEAGEHWEGALAEAGRWAEGSPRDPEPWFARGRILVRRKNPKAARTALRRALELDSNHRGAQRLLAALEEEAGDLEAAEVLYRRLVDGNPHDVEVRFRLGQTLLKLDRVDEALQVFGEAERWSGNDPGLRFRLGVLLLQNDRAAQAESVFQTMAEAHGTDPRAWYLLGVSRLAQEKNEGALKAFARVPEDSDAYPDTLVRRSIALTSLDRGDEARALLQAWVDEHPDDEEVLLALAGTWEADGEYRRAVELLEGYLSTHPTDNHRVYFTLGVLHDKLKDWRRSADYMRQSLKRNPDDPHALNYLGYTFAEHGENLEEAEGLIRRALALKPGDGFITDSLGWVFYRQGRFDEAVETLKAALAAAPDDPVIWEHLGDAQRARGALEEARRAYEKALDLAPEAKAVRDKLEALP